MINSCEVTFPNLGISFEAVPSGFQVFGFEIAFYGMIIAFGMAMGLWIVEIIADKTKQDKELYLEFAIYAVIFSVIGARIYYVIFSWEEYQSNLWGVFNLRNGGLAIYGGVIAGIITAIVYSRIKKISFWLLADTASIGLITGQIIGRWGNFFNKEAFGGYTDSLFAMRIPWNEAKYHVSANAAEELSHYVQDGMIQVHPTFLYESVWNIGVLILLLFFTKRKKFDGEIFFLYIGGYGLGRVWIEGLRTDQLLLWGSNIAVSQLLAGAMVIGAAFAFFIKYFLKKYFIKK